VQADEEEIQMTKSESATRPIVEPAQIETVLVTLDGSKASARAIPIGSSLADSVNARLRFLAVSDDGVGTQALRRDVEQLIGGSAVGSVEIISASAAGPAILGAAAPMTRAAVCMASHGRSRSAALVGSVTNEVAARSLAPIVAVGPRVDPGHAFDGRVVACVDGSPASEAGLPLVAAWAAALELPLSIITVAEPVPEPVTRGGRYRRMHGPDVDADAYIAALVERWSGHGLDVDGRAIYDPVDVVGAALDHAAGGDTALLATTTRARRGPARLLMGSVAAALVRGSAAPVLLVPPHAAPAPGFDA
jgi:nucleotide-binding universal stress UspA family protein